MKKLILLLALFVFSCTPQDQGEENTSLVIQFEAEGSRQAINLAAPNVLSSSARVDGEEIPFQIPVCTTDDIASVFIDIESVDNPEVNKFVGQLVPEFFPQAGVWQIVIDDLPPGDYEVKEFFVLDSDDNLIFAVPHIGSKYAAFVNTVVNFAVSIVAGKKLIYPISVLCVEPGELPDFGVGVFSFDITSLFHIYFFANYCSDEGHVKADIRGWTEVDGQFYPDEVVDPGYLDVVIPDEWTVPDDQELVTIWIYIENDGSWLSSTKTVEEWRNHQNSIIHLYHDCVSIWECDVVDPPENAAELLGEDED